MFRVMTSHSNQIPEVHDFTSRMSISLKTGPLSCGRCLNNFPRVSVVRCGAVLVLCKTCHRSIHPRCTKAVSLTTEADKMCHFCRRLPAILLCPLCGQAKNDHDVMALCQVCSDQLHHQGTSTHIEHTLTFPE